jgi:hypothetical protein
MVSEQIAFVGASETNDGTLRNVYLQSNRCFRKMFQFSNINIDSILTMMWII